ncbi:spore coat protein CotF [Scopulibacillus darangshiensis]|uniref:Spore coat protein CotF n=1 Tax=Scopulibacillus darangshiensis TaxID=442528 RepID=A0A4R2P3Y3_9BACL|nr:spore coat protein [Scopulibacillus darangshiensis]TCP29423.1 spore coat protein CotF [Scopulibacillus darangshiensis]
MQLAGHEFHDLSELVMSCYNTVTSMSGYIKQAQDPELKQLLEQHFPKHVADYNMKVEFLQNSSTPDITKFVPTELHPKMNNYTMSPMPQLQPVDINLNAVQHNDREIATAYLLNQKGAAMNYAKSVLECSNPDLRTFLENAFLNSSRHAYDMWQYMVSKGYYPLSPAPVTEIQQTGGIYPIVNQ